MTQEHPITPPPELVEQWAHLPADWNTVAPLIAQWGADAELEACCEWLQHDYPNIGANALRAARRPKPPSLKEQALAALDDAIMRGDCITISDALPTIRRALEALPE
jgi:hypothetical protein